MTREAEMLESLIGGGLRMIHEYYTPTILADAIADAVCPLLPDLAGTDGVVRALEPGAGIGRLVRAFTARRCAALQGATMPLERWVTSEGCRQQGTFNLVVSKPPYGEHGAAALEDTDTFYKENRAQAAARGTADGQLRAPRSNLGAEAAKLACTTGQTAAANEDGPATPPVPAKPPTPATSPAPSTPPVDPEKDEVLMDGFESTVQKLVAARKGAT